MDEEYLGDAVYARFDGYYIWLRTGDSNNQQIALDPNVFDALVAYRGRLLKAIHAKYHGDVDGDGEL